MATCPHCRGHLTDDHRCPRSPARTALELSIAALGGGLGALLVMSLVDPHGQIGFDGMVLLAGALVGVGLDRWFRA